jgi:hypothetical protein
MCGFITLQDDKTKGKGDSPGTHDFEVSEDIPFSLGYAVFPDIPRITLEDNSTTWFEPNGNLG